MVSRRSKLTVLCFIMSCMYYISMGETLIKFSYLILSYLMAENVTKNEIPSGGARVLTLSVGYRQRLIVRSASDMENSIFLRYIIMKRYWFQILGKIDPKII